MTNSLNECVRNKRYLSYLSEDLENTTAIVSHHTLPAANLKDCSLVVSDIAITPNPTFHPLLCSGDVFQYSHLP